jgi:UDP-N-acetylmuramoyl-L-alanyl-D-glutamate--2,6-diaminopimelate ligase
MLRQIKINVTKVLKSIFGESIFILYHKFLAHLAAIYYRNPSKEMLVIAVTGTKGKTSTLNFLWHVLTAGGYKVGLISTANIKIGDEELMNWYHMTMPGRFLLQRLLRKIKDGGCDIALVEATSEGIKNGRHIGLYYDMAVFTNLFPEHLAAHGGSFENYKKAKGILFENLHKLPAKKWYDKVTKEEINLQKTIVANSDTDSSEYFLSFIADKKISYGMDSGEHRATNVMQNSKGVSFDLADLYLSIPIIGVFNVYNALPAILIARELSVSEVNIEKGLSNCTVIPGRMELIDEGQDYTAIVDYAHEGVSMRLALEAAVAAKRTSTNKVIAVYGAEGGGRDLGKRVTMSKATAELADYAIVTLSDPFDADPEEINKDLVSKLESFGMIYNQNIFDYIDRSIAIAKAVSLAREGDVILFASKGAEQTIMFKDKIIPWDDRAEVRRAIINKIKNQDQI